MADPAAVSSPDLPAPPNFQQTSASATAPAFADASQVTDNQKVALLQAIAQAGSAGKQQFMAQQQTNSQQNASALQGMAQSEAGVQNMPPALAAQLGVQINQPYQFAAGQNVAAQQTLQNDVTRQNAAAGNYFGEVKASLPTLQADTQAKIAALQSAAYEKQLTDQLNLQDSQNRVKISQADLEKATAKTPANDITTWIKNQGGLQVAGTALQDQLEAYLTETKKSYPSSSFFDPAVESQTWFDSQDQKNNWPSGTTKSILDAGNTKTQQQQTTLQRGKMSVAEAGVQLSRDAQGGGILADVQAGLKQNLSPLQITQAILAKNPNVNPATIEAAITSATNNPS